MTTRYDKLLYGLHFEKAKVPSPSWTWPSYHGCAWCSCTL